MRTERRDYRSRPPLRRFVPRRRTVVLLGVLVLALVGVNLGIVLAREAEEPGPREALEPFVAAWSRGDDAAAARATDRPREAGRVLAENRKGLDGARLRVGVESFARDGDTARARLRLDWDVPRIGPWGYTTEVGLREAEDGWIVRWAPTVVHPFVDGIARLGTIRDPAKRGKIVDRRGRRLTGRDTAEALIGSVGPVTAEQLERDPRARAGDKVGQTGLEAALNARLGGDAGRRVVLRVKEVARDTLVDQSPGRGRNVKTTLDLRVQRAAERALGGRKDEAALVAVKPSTGDVLAVASTPSGGGFNRAIEGRYPPGSTFKVVSTAALLRDGLRPSEVVPCPKTINVGGRPFRNFEGGGGGSVPFTQDFAQSCNTAFASLASRLGQSDLRDTARDYGLGEPLRLPVAAPRASVPKVDDLAERAAAMIGQDRILASPLSMAGVAGTVAAGRWNAPRLLASDKRRAGRRLSARERNGLRMLMRRVVTNGTGVAVRGVPGAVRGKSGTAEYGSGNPPKTHAWFIGYRGDVALAVLVENGRAGGAVAAPIAAKFLRAL